MKRLFLIVSIFMVLLFNTNLLFAECKPYGAWNVSFVKGKEKVNVVVTIIEENNEPILTLSGPSDKKYKGKIMESKCILEFKDPEDGSLLSLTVKGEQIEGQEVDIEGKLTSKVTGYKEANISNIINKIYYIKSSQYLPVEFDISDKAKIIIGYEVIWGGDRDINSTILDELNFFKWKAKESSIDIVIFTQKKSTTYANIIDIEKGKYYALIDNTFSILTDKKVKLLIYRMDRTLRSKSFPISVNEICYDNKSKHFKKLNDIFIKLSKKCDMDYLYDPRSSWNMDEVCPKILGGKDRQIEEEIINKCAENLKNIKCKDFKKIVEDGFENTGVDNICDYIIRITK